MTETGPGKTGSAIRPTARYFEDFSIGEEWISARRTITGADIASFADLTGDHNPIHTDEAFAKTTPFGGRILHGPAVFAIATGLEMQLGLKDGTALAFLGMTWDLLAPVRIGDTIHVYQRVEAVRATRNPERGIVTFWVEVRNQHAEVCQQGQWKIMFYTRPASRG